MGSTNIISHLSHQSCIFQGRHLIIDWRKVKRYGYYSAEGRRGTEGDSWEGLPHNSDPGQIVHFQQCWHLKKSNPRGEFKAGPEADLHLAGYLAESCEVPWLSFNYHHNIHSPPSSSPPTLPLPHTNTLRPLIHCKRWPPTVARRFPSP